MSRKKKNQVAQGEVENEKKKGDQQKEKEKEEKEKKEKEKKEKKKQEKKEKEEKKKQEKKEKEEKKKQEKEKKRNEKEKKKQEKKQKNKNQTMKEEENEPKESKIRRWFSIKRKTKTEQNNDPKIEESEPSPEKLESEKRTQKGECSSTTHCERESVPQLKAAEDHTIKQEMETTKGAQVEAEVHTTKTDSRRQSKHSDYDNTMPRAENSPISAKRGNANSGDSSGTVHMNQGSQTDGVPYPTSSNLVVVQDSPVTYTPSAKNTSSGSNKNHCSDSERQNQSSDVWKKPREESNPNIQPTNGSTLTTNGKSNDDSFQDNESGNSQPTKNRNKRSHRKKKRYSSNSTPEQASKNDFLMVQAPRGLQNLGNTCFFNAVMQNLNQSAVLGECLKECKTDLPLTKAMVQFYKEMNQQNRNTFNPGDVFRGVCDRSPRFNGGRQQDSHELLRHLLDGLRNEEREASHERNKKKILTNVDRVFGGHFMTVYTCKECGKPYHVCEPLLDISLPIAFTDDVKLQDDNQSSANCNSIETYEDATRYMMTPLSLEAKEEEEGEERSEADTPDLQSANAKRKSNNKNAAHDTAKKSRNDRSLEDCLKAFTKTEHIDKEYLCTSCNQGLDDYMMTSATKRTLIYNPPALLTLHLKRFKEGPHGFVKCNNPITFPLMLNLSPYCSCCCMRNKDNEKDIWYSLYGIVVHGGSLNGGHYVAYVKRRTPDENIQTFLQPEFLDRDSLTPDTLVKTVKGFHDAREKEATSKLEQNSETGEWYYISDSHCSRAENVLREQAYLLFYERVANRPTNRPTKFSSV